MNMRGQQFQKMSIRRLVLEVIFLTIAVFFALAVDEGWEDYENSEAANLALSRVLLELEGNEVLISEANEQHGLELARFQPVVELLNTQKSIPEGFDAAVNFQISIMRNTAWESAQLTDVLRYLPYEKVQKFAAVYSLQELYQNQTMQIFNYQGSVEFIGANADVQLQSAFQRLLKIYAIEQALQTAYAQFHALGNSDSK
ncbi:MAG: hypothetical protein DRR06_18145 [Gammaproteobacteria bacterium]|nr:MAG: hypothetical protein DRR06_18145 [Gammaproteobacteria bacterium]